MAAPSQLSGGSINVRKLIALSIVVAVMGGGVATSTAQANNGNTNYYASAKRAVCAVFGGYCSQAMAVVRCETGGTYYPWATNGQYLGIFQMGSSERRTYGHGPDVWSQARAAYKYFVASGRDWSPWSCKPW